jgi:hypothetical protein
MVGSNDYATMLIWLGILALAVLSWALVSRRIARRRFYCPWSGADVKVDFVDNSLTRERVDVLSCTAFGSEEAEGCEKKCLHLTMEGPSSSGSHEKEQSRLDAERDVKGGLS